MTNSTQTIDTQVAEILRNFGSRERFIGVVDHFDLAGTTAYVKDSNGAVFLAFASDTPGLQPGTLVSYRRDQMRAKDLIVIKPEQSVLTTK